MAVKEQFEEEHRVRDAVSRELVEVLACPQCRKPLTVIADVLDCEGCHRAYPVRNGIPILFASNSAELLARIQLEKELYKAMTIHDHDAASHRIWSEVKDRVHSTVLRLAEERGCKRILYVGSGRDQMYKLFHHARVVFVNVDIVFEALAELRSQGAAYAVCCDARDPPFAEASFDMLICADILHHLFEEDLHGVLNRLLRTLKPEGLIVIQEPNKYCLLRLPICWVPHRLRLILRALRRKILARDTAPAPHESPLSARQIVSALRRSGMRCVERLVCPEYPGSALVTSLFKRAVRFLPVLPREFGYHFMLVASREPGGAQ